MKTTSSLLSLTLLFSLTVLVPSVAFPHGGGLDAYGCHHDRKAGGYHCHRGQFAGQSFASQEEMLAKLNQGTAASKGAQPQQQNNPTEKSIGTTPTGKTLYVGPRGGVYHYSASGRKVYERRK